MCEQVSFCNQYTIEYIPIYHILSNPVLFLYKPSCWFKSDMFHFHKVWKETHINCFMRIRHWEVHCSLEMSCAFTAQNRAIKVFRYQASGGMRSLRKVDGLRLCFFEVYSVVSKMKVTEGSSLVWSLITWGLSLGRIFMQF